MSRRVAGRRAVTEALQRAGQGLPSVVYVDDPKGKSLRDLVELAKQRRVAVEARSRDELDALAEGVRHQGVIAIVGDYDYSSLEAILAAAGEDPLLVALDEITDPHNLGAIVRSAVAFGADGVLVPKHRAASVTPVVVRASAGATEHAKIAKVTNLQKTLASLADQGLSIVGLAGEGEHLITELAPAPLGRVVVVGSEGSGLRRMVRQRCDILARIEQPGPIASLNASVAAGIALHEAARRREETRHGDSTKSPS